MPLAAAPPADAAESAPLAEVAQTMTFVVMMTGPMHEGSCSKWIGSGAEWAWRATAYQSDEELTSYHESEWPKLLD